MRFTRLPSGMHVPIVILGGGGCGLATSIFLSDYGAPHVLLERHPGTAILPKAGSYTQRTMEILRQHGLADAIYELGPTPEQVSKVAFYTSLAGEGPLDRRRIHVAPFLGFAEPDRSIHERDSPARGAILPQWDLEPVLRRAAEERNPGRILFSHECVSFRHDEDGVSLRVLDRGTGHETTITADYLIAADGGRTVGPQVGVMPQGASKLADMVSLIFEADLGDLLPEDDVIIWFFVNPDGGPYSSGVLVPQGSPESGWNGGPRAVRRWRLNVRFAMDDPAADIDERRAVNVVRSMLHADDLAVKIIGVSHWTLEAVVAERFRVGRIFIAGDAAHRQPPTTGLGLNSAIQDGHNLAWKLSAVLQGWASDALLDTYDTERRPVDAHQVKWAMFTFNNLGRTLVAGLGIGAEMTLEQRRQVFTELLSDTPFGATRRALLKEVWATQRIEFNPHDLDLGYSYGADGAVVGDGSLPPPRDPMGVIYRPTTRPGHRLPHAWLERDGRRISLHDVLPCGGFALLTSVEGAGWRDAARDVTATTGVPLLPVTIGDATCDCRDADGRWAEVREIEDGGAILVRPDGFVGWRAASASRTPVEDLQAALAGVLRRHESDVATPKASIVSTALEVP